MRQQIRVKDSIFVPPKRRSSIEVSIYPSCFRIFNELNYLIHVIALPGKPIYQGAASVSNRLAYI